MYFFCFFTLKFVRVRSRSLKRSLGERLASLNEARRTFTLNAAFADFANFRPAQSDGALKQQLPNHVDSTLGVAGGGC